MNRSGCPIGYEDRGRGCQVTGKKKYIPFDVTNLTGCKEMNGKWTDTEDGDNVCLLKDTSNDEVVEGWTAPIRGLYIQWQLYKQNADDLLRYDQNFNQFAEELHEEHGIKDFSPWAYEGYIQACAVKDDKDYPDEPGADCGSLIPETYAGEIAWDMWGAERGISPTFDEIRELFREVALDKAAFFMKHEDRLYPHDFKYFNRAGSKIPMWEPDAMPVSIKSDYGQDKPVSIPDRQPFRLRRW